MRRALWATGALLVLTAASTGLSLLPLGAFHTTAALAIAAVKVALVALFFMELAESRGSLRLVAVTAPLFIVILVGFALMDVVTR